MSDDPHRAIAVECFNACWDLITKAARTPEDDEAMRRLAEVSYWAWTQSPACTRKHVAVGLWQLSRVYAISGLGPQALRYAEQSLKAHEEAQLSDFYWGYAYEALARAASACGDATASAAALKEAAARLERVVDSGEYDMLAADLKTLQQC